MAFYCSNCGCKLRGQEKFCGMCGNPCQKGLPPQKKKSSTQKKKVIGIVCVLLSLAIIALVIVLIASNNNSPKKLLESTQWLRSTGTDKTECIFFDTVYINHRKNIDEIGSTRQVASYTVDSENTIVAKYNTHVSTHAYVPLKEDDIANGLFNISDDDWSVTEHYLVYNGKVYMDEEFYWDHYYDDYDDYSE